METQPPRGALWMVRAALVAAAVTQPAGGQRPLLRVVYTSRCRDDHFAHRRVPTNEKAMLDDLRVVLSAAHSTAVEVVSFHGRETPFAEAVQVFGSADVVLGVHGAALSNAVFCRSGTALVEVTMRRGFGFPIGFRDYAHLAAALDLSYYAIPLDLDYSAKVQLPVLPAYKELGMHSPRPTNALDPEIRTLYKGGDSIYCMGNWSPGDNSGYWGQSFSNTFHHDVQFDFGAGAYICTCLQNCKKMKRRLESSTNSRPISKRNGTTLRIAQSTSLCS